MLPLLLMSAPQEGFIVISVRDSSALPTHLVNLRLRIYTMVRDIPVLLYWTLRSVKVKLCLLSHKILTSSAGTREHVWSLTK